MRTDHYISMNSRLPELVREAVFSLKFKEGRAVFDIMDSSTLNQDDQKAITSLIGMDDYAFWQDSLAAYTVFRSVERFGLGPFLLVSTLENGAYTAWVITDETKEISGYLCVKAIRMDIDIDAKNDNRKSPVIAWFTPELPFSFGPQNYGGLPGLILELQTQHELFSVTNIELNTEVEIPPLPDFERKAYNDLNKLLYDEILGRN